MSYPYARKAKLAASNTSSESSDSPSTSKSDSDTTKDETINTCADCRVTECLMWRRFNNELICNLCHLKRIKNSSQNGVNSRNNTQSKTKEVQAVRVSKRKNKTNKKFVNGFYNERLVKNGNSKSRRTLMKKKPVKSAEEIAKIITANSMYHNGLLYQIGDIVCTSDIEGGTFYAQIRGFFQDDYCEKSVVVTWLIPKIPNPTHFDPMLFVPALDEDTPRPMECFDFVCRASTDLLKSRILHTPYLRSQSNLSCLVQAASQLSAEEISHDGDATDTDTASESAAMDDSL